MLATDTNVVVRYLVGDDPEQAARARALIDTQAVYLPVTVVLETDWVLRSAYGFGRVEVARALRAFGGLPTVTVEDAARVADALDRAEAGMDLADALHAGRAEGCTGFVTFDKRLIASAAAAGLTGVRAP
jgi:predicted nucleic-acid-binding protein